MLYNIYIGSPESKIFWTQEAKKEADLLPLTDEIIGQLSPINSSSQGAEEYRSRFRGQQLFALPAINTDKKKPQFIGILSK